MYTAMSSAKSWPNQALGQAQAKESIDAASRYGIVEAIKRHLAAGTDVNAKDDLSRTPLDYAEGELADLLRKHGGKTGEELKAEGK